MPAFLRAASRPAAVVEIGSSPSVSVRGELIRTAFLASARKPVALVLDDASRAQVDRILDQVAHHALDFAGVVYCRPDELEGLLLEHGDPEFAVVQAPHLRRLMAKRRVRLVSQLSAVRDLRRLVSASAEE